MNQILFASITAMILAQIIKLPIYYFKNGKFYPQIILSTGSMPSSHTAFVIALSTSVGIIDGIYSSTFAIATVFAMITLHDAVKVRGESGKQAIAINELSKLVDQIGKTVNPRLNRKTRHEELKTLIGHTTSEVFAGFALGLIWPFIYFLLIK